MRQLATACCVQRQRQQQQHAKEERVAAAGEHETPGWRAHFTACCDSSGWCRWRVGLIEREHSAVAKEGATCEASCRMLAVCNDWRHLASVVHLQETVASNGSSHFLLFKDIPYFPKISNKDSHQLHSVAYDLSSRLEFFMENIYICIDICYVQYLLSQFLKNICQTRKKNRNFYRDWKMTILAFFTPFIINNL